MSKSIFVTGKIPDVGIKMLKEKGYLVDVNPEDLILTQKQIISFLRKKSYDAVLSLLNNQINSAVFDAAPTVKLFSNYATGYDNIDVAEAKARGISVTNAPTDLSSEAVAEYTIALIFALAKRIVEADEFYRYQHFRQNTRACRCRPDW